MCITKQMCMAALRHNFFLVSHVNYFFWSNYIGKLYLFLLPLTGWTNWTKQVMCCFLMFVDINECTPGVCANGGQCIDGINGFTCACSPSFTGKTCDQCKYIFIRYTMNAPQESVLMVVNVLMASMDSHVLVAHHLLARHATSVSTASLDNQWMHPGCLC